MALAPTPDIERVWWARLYRAAERQGPAASKLMSDWANDVITVCAPVGLRVEIVPGQGWVEIPPERFTDEYIARETRRLTDELGERLGVGPRP